MTTLGTRSGTQILRTFLPQQTSDMRGGIYRVVEWTSAIPLSVDTEVIRRRLVREIRSWTKAGTDGGLAADLLGGASIEVVELDDRRGVTVERFPQVWLCSCKRIGKDRNKACRCGLHRWGQLHFLGFHSCGAVVEPWIRRCPAHDDVKLVSPRSAKAADIRFVCPECDAVLMEGLGFNRQCPGCSKGTITWNVHKARSVYAPHGVVLVNPPRPERMRELLSAGGARKALSWVVEGMTASSPAEMGGRPTREEFVDKIVVTGMDRSFAEGLADQAAAAGQLADANAPDSFARLPELQLLDAEHEALEIATAVAESRITIGDLSNSPVDSTLATRYARGYPAALKAAGIVGIDLVDRFPILNVMYGFTRGGGEAGESRLVPFRKPRGGYRMHGDLAETEAYLVRLDPVRVADWLVRRGHSLPGYDASVGPAAARVAIINSAAVPPAGDVPPVPTAGSDLLTLVHSYSHRFMRQTAVFAGIDRDALSEYLLPLQLAFFVYATSRGDFVLGGLQAVFETDLDELLDTIVRAEHRCPLDPGCSRGRSACSACLHVGEPSCRAFNTFLDRRALFGEDAFLHP